MRGVRVCSLWLAMGPSGGVPHYNPLSALAIRNNLTGYEVSPIFQEPHEVICDYSLPMGNCSAYGKS